MRAIESACAGVLLAVAACGGNAFTAAPGEDAGGRGGDSGSRADAAPIDGAGAGEGGISTDASPVEGGPLLGVPCGPGKVCAGMTPVCCAGTSFDCAHLQCGCTTQVECASNVDCGGLTPVCCINRRPADATCGMAHFVARCDTACFNGGLQMCDPNARNTCINAQCSSDSGDLANEGLPANSGYGVCK